MQDLISFARRKLKFLPGYSILRRLYLVGTVPEHWARIVMNRETEKLIATLPINGMRALEISGEEWGRKMHFKAYESVHYPQFDVCESALDETFDLIIAEQVFEHLLWPYRAGKNIYKMLQPGGYFLLTTPFLIRIHNFPTDCTRWTGTGIKYLLAECGFDLERVRTGSWGNRACIRANFFRWALFRPLLHSLRNEPDFPIVVWAIAQK